MYLQERRYRNLMSFCFSKDICIAQLYGNSSSNNLPTSTQRLALEVLLARTNGKLIAAVITTVQAGLKICGSENIIHNSNRMGTTNCCFLGIYMRSTTTYSSIQVRTSDDVWIICMILCLFYRRPINYSSQWTKLLRQWPSSLLSIRQSSSKNISLDDNLRYDWNSACRCWWMY